MSTVPVSGMRVVLPRKRRDALNTTRFRHEIRYSDILPLPPTTRVIRLELTSIFSYLRPHSLEKLAEFWKIRANRSSFRSVGIKDKQDGEYYSIEPVKARDENRNGSKGKRSGREEGSFYGRVREREENWGPRAVRRKIERNFHLGSVGLGSWSDRGEAAWKGRIRVGGRVWALRSSW